MDKALAVQETKDIFYEQNCLLSAYRHFIKGMAELKAIGETALYGDLEAVIAKLENKILGR